MSASCCLLGAAQLLLKHVPLLQTYNWNLAWAKFMNSSYSSIIYSNNDVLVPDGAISLLQESLSGAEGGGNCDLVSATSIGRCQLRSLPNWPHW